MCHTRRTKIYCIIPLLHLIAYNTVTDVEYVSCLCFFKCKSDKWSPALQIRTVLLSIQALLSAPNPDDPLANDVAEQWKTNESLAIETGTFV